MSAVDYAAARADIVAYWDGLTKTQLWSLDTGDIHNLLDIACEQIEAWRAVMERLAAINCAKPPSGKHHRDPVYCGTCASCLARSVLCR